jgi:hypothetical protein
MFLFFKVRRRGSRTPAIFQHFERRLLLVRLHQSIFNIWRAHGTQIGEVVVSIKVKMVLMGVCEYQRERFIIKSPASASASIILTSQ